MSTSPITLDDLHSGHDCDPGQCLCRCGCDRKLGCRTILGPLCTMCHHEHSWGDGEHGFPETVSEKQ